MRAHDPCPRVVRSAATELGGFGKRCREVRGDRSAVYELAYAQESSVLEERLLEGVYRLFVERLAQVDSVNFRRGDPPDMNIAHGVLASVACVPVGRTHWPGRAWVSFPSSTMGSPLTIVAWIPCGRAE